MYLLGYDIGSSSIKAALLEAESGKLIASAISPDTEMVNSATQPDWAEQQPEIWWDHVKRSTALIKKKSAIDISEIVAIGISYQMHGLVVVDKSLQILRPSIIWCDSRAVQIGDKAFRELGEQHCLNHYLNSPGNFTASKLAWVKENEPDVYKRIYKIMLPGEYIALKMTGEIKTTPSGLSEGIFWDFRKKGIAQDLLDYYGISSALLPEIVPVFSVQGKLLPEAAKELKLSPGTKVSYRAGDQPNNALSLNVLNPGELAATAGTSGVVYGIASAPVFDPKSRVNTFVHVNHSNNAPRNGVLLCVNGTGKLYSWLKHNLVGQGKQVIDYPEMNSLATKSPVGARGLTFLPFGNGAERTLENKNILASLHHLNLNVHSLSDILRAAQEGIVFALNYGVEVMREMGLKIQNIRAGQSNMFLSPLFAEAFATTCGATVELYNTDGAQGAARGAGLGAGIYKNSSEAFADLESIKIIEPNVSEKDNYIAAYNKWMSELENQLNRKDQ
jgi:xylulokinase